MSESIWDDPRITAYVLGELPDDERTAFESQLESDSELAAAVDEARSVTGQLEELYAAEPTPMLDSERRDAIVSGDPQASLPNDESRSWKVPALLLATAAALLLLVGIAPMLRQQELETTISQVSDEQAQAGEDGLPRQLDGRSSMRESVARLDDEMPESDEKPFDAEGEQDELRALGIEFADRMSGSDNGGKDQAATEVSGALAGGSDANDNGIASNKPSRTQSLSRRANLTPATSTETQPLPAGMTVPEYSVPQQQTAQSQAPQDQGQAAQSKPAAPSLAKMPASEMSIAPEESYKRLRDSRSLDESDVLDEADVWDSELGTMVLRGSKRDVDRVKGLIEQQEKSSELEGMKGKVVRGVVKQIAQAPREEAAKTESEGAD